MTSPRPTSPRAARHDVRLVPAALGAWGAAAGAVAQGDPASRWLVPVGGALAVVAVVLLVVARRAGERPVGALGLVALVAASAGVVAVSVGAHDQVRTAGLLSDLVTDRATVAVTGLVVSEPAPLPRTSGAGGGSAPEGPRYRLVLQVDTVAGRGRTGPAAASVLALVDADVSTAPRYGARVRAAGRLVPTSPGDREVALLVVTRSPEVRAPPGPVDSVTGLLRGSLVEASAGLGADTAGLLPALAVGDTTGVPEDLTAAMRAVGLTHVMAVSGAHFAIVGTCVLGLTAVARLRRKARVLVLVPVMAGFVLLVHPGASVLRAAGMGAVATIGLLLGRPSRALPALAATVVVLVVVDPWLARDYGFVLSVLATAGLVLLTGPLADRARRVVGRPVAYAVAVPVAAQVVCAPVIVLLTPGVATLAVPANLLAAPAVAPATVLGVLTALVAPWWPAAGAILAHAAGVPVWWIAQVARRAAAVPGATLGWPSGSGGAALLAVVTAVPLVLLLRVAPAQPDDVRPQHRSGGRSGRHASARAHRALLVLGIGVVVIVAATGILRARVVAGRGLAQDWRVVACDVGQGDGLVMRTAPHHAVVVDVGPAGGGMRACLDRLGVTTIDLLVLTHFHADHVGGLDEVLGSRPVGRALVSALREPTAEAAGALQSLAQAGVPVDAPVIGAPQPDGSVPAEPTTASARTTAMTVRTTGTVGDVRWTVLWAPPRGGSGSVPSAAPVVAAASVLSTVSVTAGTVASRDGATRSTRASAAEESAPNDAGLVLLLEAPDLRVVDLADLESGAQDALAAALRRSGALGPVDVVKTAHHGSANQSSALAELIDARVALVSVGRDNPYGHPARAALDLYEHAGATVLRTDTCHDIGLSVRAGELVLHAGCRPP
ncbi:ComEC/Rec2 family competence protein [Cellulomonas sp. P24]|uniref:ComEC/Rec2 family competence protein n=1 Tax=Cellulomonas sp. P24 TaxID=2885206 RepID=UPI00216B048F|nr:ComEC/Rec2 family competence protein [Cellulomonas sp. P24]MCR6494072.1 ComEC/Rec2 family competence protein [Cellulomonas sp. P24]